MPELSFLRNHNVFMAMAGNEDAQNQEWTSHNFFTFIKHEYLVPILPIFRAFTGLC